MSNSSFPQYPWLIDFTDIEDAVLRQQGAAFFLNNPDATKNYYFLTAEALIDLAATKGVPADMVNAVNPPHYLLVEWQKSYLQEQACLNLMGLNDVEAQYDKYKVKQSIYHDKLIQIQGKITFETFITAQMQQNYTRQSVRTFNIAY